MGYSIACRAQSARLRRRMLAFMSTHYRSWPLLSTGKDGDCYAGAPSGDLDYDRRAKNAVGVNCKVCSGWEREYAYTIVRWMAIQIGTRTTRFGGKIGTLKREWPVFVYDGHEKWPVMVCGVGQHTTKFDFDCVEDGLRWTATDRYGVRLLRSQMVGDALFDLPLGPHEINQISLRAREAAGPQTNDPAWHERHQEALAEDPQVRASLDLNFDTIRREMRRLTRAWARFNPHIGSSFDDFLKENP